MSLNLIIESGSTKSDWQLFDKSKLLFECTSSGLNPKSKSFEEISRIIEQNFTNFSHQIENIYFYGSGILGHEIKMRSILQAQSNSKIEIFSDIYGAANCANVNENRIVCILGTGSYAAYFEGQKIIDKKLGHGFIIGDVCSGSEFGKKMIQDYLNGKLPNEIKEDLDQHYNFSLKELYSSLAPSQYLASFFPLLIEYKNHPYSKKLIQDQIKLLNKNGIFQLLSDRVDKIQFIGGVANQIQNELKDVIHLDIDLTFIERPINGLRHFHNSIDSKN